MGIWDSILHPRVQGRFVSKGGRLKSTGRPIPASKTKVKGSAGGGGGARSARKKTKGPTKAEVSLVAAVIAGKIYTTDGGRTWSRRGARSTGTATATVLRAEKDKLLAAVGRTGLRPTLAGIAAVRAAPKPAPVAKKTTAKRTRKVTVRYGPTRG